MQGEPAHAHDADPGGAPLPPVTTRLSVQDGADPGTAGARLAPFRAGATPAFPAPQTLQPQAVEPSGLPPEAAVGLEPARPETMAATDVATAPEPAAALELPVIAAAADTATAPEPAVELETPVIAAAAEEMGLVDEQLAEEAHTAGEGVGIDERGEEEPWALTPAVTAPSDADVELDTAEAEEPWVLPADAVVEEEPWALPESESRAAAADVLVGEEAGEEVAEPVPPLDSVPPHQQWDAFGRALQDVVTWDESTAAPPAEAATSEGAAATEAYAAEPWEAPAVPAEAEAETVEPWETPAAAAPEHEAEATTASIVTAADEAAARTDPFSGELADRLQALTDRLRRHGAAAIADAIQGGDRLDASLALFLAGYQAGRGD